MANMSGYSKEAKIAVHHRAKIIVRESGAKCQFGGCHNHGQEYCDLDTAWEDAMDRAKEELCDDSESEAG